MTSSPRRNLLKNDPSQRPRNLAIPVTNGGAQSSFECVELGHALPNRRPFRVVRGLSQGALELVSFGGGVADVVRGMAVDRDERRREIAAAVETRRGQVDGKADRAHDEPTK